MRNIFYYVAFLIRHIGVISIAHIILLQARSQEFLRAGQAFANQGTSFQQLIGTKLHENLQITLVNILTLLCNLMIQRITKNINVSATRKNVVFCCYTISGVKKIISRSQTFRARNFTCAPARTCKIWVLKAKMYVQSRHNQKH